MIVVVSGIRDLHPDDVFVVKAEVAMFGQARSVSEWRTGGAMGVDAAALSALWELYPHHAARTTWLPVSGSPPEAARALVQRCSSEIIDLGLPRQPASFPKRNKLMLDGWTPTGPRGKADWLLAFTDRREHGGTAGTSDLARAIGVQVQVVEVRAR